MTRFGMFLVTFVTFNLIALTAGMVMAFDHTSLAKNVVFVYSKVGSCTGTVIEDNLVLTAYQCMEKETFVSRTPWVDREAHANKKTNFKELAKVVKADKESDLLLLEVDLLLDGDVSFAEPIIDEEIMIVGYPIGEYRAVRGRVTGLSGKYRVWINMNILAGSSGSLAYNAQGQVIGLMSAGRTDGHNTEMQLIHPRVIQQFLDCGV